MPIGMANVTNFVGGMNSANIANGPRLNGKRGESGRRHQMELAVAFHSHIVDVSEYEI